MKSIHILDDILMKGQHADAVVSASQQECLRVLSEVLLCGACTGIGSSAQRPSVED